MSPQSWKVAKAPPPARLGWTLLRSSPWLTSSSHTDRSRDRTDMAAPKQPQKSTYDVIVIGAGIQGSFTAYHLAQRHKNTLLLEQVW